MTLVGFRAQNHRQQVSRRGPNPKVDDRQTSPEVFDPLQERFDFTIDVAALNHNRKVERYFAPPGHGEPLHCMWNSECHQPCPCPHRATAIDGLAQSWHGERVWCNPPYSSIEPWVQKAHAEWAGGNPELIVMLLPANRTEQGWWQRQIEPHLRAREPWFSVEFLSGRLRFIAHDATEIKPNERPPFGCCLAIWDKPR